MKQSNEEKMADKFIREIAIRHACDGSEGPSAANLLIIGFVRGYKHAINHNTEDQQFDKRKQEKLLELLEVFGEYKKSYRGDSDPGVSFNGEKWELWYKGKNGTTFSLGRTVEELIRYMSQELEKRKKSEYTIQLTKDQEEEVRKFLMEKYSIAVKPK